MMQFDDKLGKAQNYLKNDVISNYIHVIGCNSILSLILP